MMNYQEITDTYKQAIKTYGEKAQKLMAIEEMSELTKEIARVKEAHRRHEFAEVNTFQLFVLEDRLRWVEKKIARRERHDYN